MSPRRRLEDQPRYLRFRFMMSNALPLLGLSLNSGANFEGRNGQSAPESVIVINASPELRQGSRRSTTRNPVS